MKGDNATLGFADDRKYEPLCWIQSSPEYSPCFCSKIVSVENILLDLDDVYMNRYKECVSSIDRLMKEWNWEENNKRGLDPNKLTLGSGKKANWICLKGHDWDADICHRVGRGSNCPYCANKKAWPGYNDLRSQRPDLMQEWDFKTNTIDPSNVVVQ